MEQEMVARRMAAPHVETLRPALLDWYDREARTLPWRELSGGSTERWAWGVWLSEIMAQQTRLEVVVPYWERFMERYPTPCALAAASEEEVLAAWSGLGYYRRARQLRDAAGRVAQEGWPRTAAEWQELPGIGPYTAAAIASIVEGEVVAVVDGNVERVVTRLLEFEGDPRKAEGRRTVRRGAEALVDERRPGDSNQAMMELGALVCRRRGPRCDACPLASACRARATGRTEEIPRRRTRRSVERSFHRLAVVRQDERILLVRRRDGEGVLAGFWELPSVESGEDERVDVVEARFTERFGGRWTLGPARARIRHTITHRLLTLEAHPAEWLVSDGIAEGGEAAWCAPADLGARPVGAATTKILDALGG